MDELVFFSLLAIPWCAALAAAVDHASPCRGINKLWYGGLATCLMAAIVALQVKLPFVVPLDSWWPGLGTDQSHGDLPLSLGLDVTGCVVIAVLGLLAACLAVWTDQTERAGTRILLSFILAMAVTFWMVDSLWIAACLQSGLLLLVFGVLGSSEGTEQAGRSAREFWMTMFLVDLLLIFGISLLLTGMRIHTFRELTDAMPVADADERTLALISTIGTLLWLGTLARLLQFPCSQVAENLRLVQPLACAGALLLGVSPVAFRWLLHMAAWWEVADVSRNLILSWSALSGFVAAWFAVCSREARSRILWLASWSWSWGAMGLLQFVLGHEDFGLLPLLGSWIAVGWLLTRWEADAPLTSQRDHSPQPENASPFFFASVSGLHGAESQPPWVLRLKSWVETMNQATRDARRPVQGWRVRGGRWCVLPGLLGLLIGPVLCSVSGGMGEPQPVFFSIATSVETTSPPNDEGDESATIPGSVAAIPRHELMRGLRFGSLVLSAWAGLLLIGTAAQSATAPASGRLLVVGLLAVLSPWGFSLLIKPVSPAPPTLSGIDSLITGAALICGSMAGILAVRQLHRGVLPQRMNLWARLGDRRLYLSTWTYLLLNLPVRSLAQVANFSDRVILDRVLPAGLKRIPRWGMDQRVGLHQCPPAFFALSLGMGMVAVTLTVLWLAQ